MDASAPPERKAMMRGILIDLAIMTVIGVVLALIGPFGSFNDPLALRLIVWLGFSYLGYACYAPIDTVAQRLAPQLDLPVWAVRFAACLVASVPMALAVWILPRLPDHLYMPSANEALAHYLYVFLVGGLITVVFTLVRRAKGEEPAQPLVAGTRATSAPPSGPRFLDRLPPTLGSDLIALEMEDHYVRAHTPLGSELVLLRMRDAVAELEGLDGAQVHRSWWVARGAVEDVKREGRNVRLVLEGGLEAPVSRANVKPLRDAGWL